MANKPREFIEPKRAVKRNPGMRSYGHDLPPAGPMRHVDRDHLLFQERFGEVLLVGFLIGLVWAMWRVFTS